MRKLIHIRVSPTLFFIFYSKKKQEEREKHDSDRHCQQLLPQKYHVQWLLEHQWWSLSYSNLLSASDKDMTLTISSIALSMAARTLKLTQKPPRQQALYIAIRACGAIPRATPEAYARKAAPLTTNPSAVMKCEYHAQDYPW